MYVYIYICIYIHISVNIESHLSILFQSKCDVIFSNSIMKFQHEFLSHVIIICLFAAPLSLSFRHFFQLFLMYLLACLRVCAPCTLSLSAYEAHLRRYRALLLNLRLFCGEIRLFCGNTRLFYGDEALVDDLDALADVVLSHPPDFKREHRTPLRRYTALLAKI